MSWAFFLITFFSGFYFSFAQCPTTTITFQSFCDIDAPTIANLQASDNGGGIAWFDTATSTTPLAFGTGLINGEDYFLDNSNGNCGNRVAVTVSISTAPTGPNFQGVCVSSVSQATLASLIATGNNIQWYSTAFGGLPLPITTVLTSNTIYYAGQTNPITGCITSRLAVFVIVNLIEVPTGEAVQFFCNDLDNPPTINDIVASGTNNWYLSNTSVLVLSPTTPLVNGQTYYGTTVSPPCESTERLEVLVNLIPENEAGENGSIIICESDLSTSGNVNLFENLIGTPSTTGTWEGPISLNNGNLGSLDLSQLVVSESPYVFTYIVTDSEFCPPASATITITIIENANAGTNGTAVFCESDFPTDLFEFLGNEPDLGGTWSPALASGSGIFDPSADTAGVYTYTLTGIESCPSDFATVTVTIIENADAGISGSATFCETDASTDLFTFLGGTPDFGGIWTPTLNSGTGIFNPSVDLAGDYIYTIPGTDPCTSSFATVTVTVVDNLNAGIGGFATLCESDAPVDLFTFLGGNPDLGGTWTPSLTSGTGIFNPSIDSAGVYTYTLSGSTSCPSDSATVTVIINENLNAGTDGIVIFCETDSITDLFTSLGGNPDLGGTWSPVLASGTGEFNPAVDLSGIYTYTLSGTDSCPSDSATVTVSVDDILEAGENGTFTLCETDLATANDINLFNQLLGNPSNSGIWSGPVATTNGNLGTLVISNLTASGSPYVFTYTVTNSNSCPNTQSNVTVIVEPAKNAGIDGNITFCSNNAPANLFTFLGGNPNLGGTWSPPLASGSGIFNPAIDLAGVYTYTLAGTTSCPSDSATVTVTVIERLDSGISGTVTFCENDAPTDLFTILGGNPDVGGIWSPSLASGTGFFNPALDPAAVYTYTLEGTSPCLPSVSTVTVNVDTLPTNTFATINLGTICLNSEANIAITNATNLANGNYQLTYQISGEITFNGITTVFFENGTTNFTIPASVFNSIGTNTITVNPIQSNIINECGVSGTIFNPVSFTIEDVATPIFMGSKIFCETDNATIANLSVGIVEPQEIVWYNAPINGEIYASTTELINETTYYAAIVSLSGCESSTRLEITVSIEDCKEDELIIPDGFSPNGDGINDAFEIKNIRTLYPNFKIKIYNRWGNVLFEGNANKPDWDGTNQEGLKVGDQKPPVGVYFYIIYFNDGVKKDRQGRVYLSR